MEKLLGKDTVHTTKEVYWNLAEKERRRRGEDMSGCSRLCLEWECGRQDRREGIADTAESPGRVLGRSMWRIQNGRPVRPKGRVPELIPGSYQGGRNVYKG